MPQLLLIRWRDIPAQIIARHGRQSEKRELSLRFVEAVDRAAMRAGLAGSDDYLAEWQRGEDTMLLEAASRRAGADASLARLADAAAAEIESSYDDARLKALVLNDGRA